jgi:hypothetical protein
MSAKTDAVWQQQNQKPSLGALVFHCGGAMVIFTGFHGSAS